MRLIYFHGSPGVTEESEELKKVLAPDHQLVAEVVAIEGVIGYSWGCIDALRFANKKQTSVKALVLVSPFLTPKKTLLSLINEIPISSDAFIRLLAKKAITKFIDKTSDPENPTNFYLSLSEKLADVKVLKKSIKEKAEITDQEIADLIKNNKIPTLVVNSESDIITDLLSISVKLSAENITIVQLTGYGHALPMQHPEELSKHISAFLNKI